MEYLSYGHATKSPDGDGRPVQQIIAERREECIERNVTDSDNYTPQSNGPWCPLVFDGWSCFEKTLAGRNARVACPNFIVGFDENRYGYRSCLEDGTWYSNPVKNETWTNYTTCVDYDSLKHLIRVNLVYKIGYSASLLALLVSLFLFYYFKTLTCTRVQIHKNFFISLACSCLLWLIWYKTVIEDVDMQLQNGVWCRVIFASVHYFTVATYTWMFCEGLYLYILLKVAFLSDSSVIYYMLSIGWGIPAVVMCLYCILRIASNDNRENTMCWISESKYEVVMYPPIFASLACNLVFLFYIVRLLLEKVPSDTTVLSTNERNCDGKLRAKKGAKATGILILLFGLHYLMVPIRPEAGSNWELPHSYLSATLASFQGLLVSSIICFFNGEVITALRRKWSLYRVNRRKSWNPTSASKIILLEYSSTNRLN